MSLFPTRRHVSGRNLMRQAKWLLAITKFAGCSKKSSLVLTKGLQKDPAQVYIMLFIVYPSKLFIHAMSRHIVKTSDRQKTHKIFRLTFLHTASYDLIGCCTLFLCVALCKHTCCIAENTSILKVTTVTCVSIIGTVGQVVLNTSASQVVQPNGTSTLSIVSI